MDIREGAKAAASKSVEVSKAVGKATLEGGKQSVVGYWKGLTYPFKGLKFVFFSHPGLVRFWIFPILITSVLVLGSLWGGWAAHEAVTNSMWQDPTEQVDGSPHKDYGDRSLTDKPKPSGTADKVLGGGDSWTGDASHWAHVALEWTVLLLLWATGLLVVVMLTNVVAAPFNDFLSEEVERLITGTPGPPFSLAVIFRDTVRTVGLEALKLLIYLVIMVPLWLVSLAFPVVGQVIYSIFAFLFTAVYFAVDYIDWPASRRNKSMTYRFGMLTDHFMPMFGFGTGVWLFLFVPFVNLLFMPAAVAGGTMLFLELEGEEQPAPSF